MRKIADAIKAIVLENDLLSFGFQNGLYNLSELSRYIKPLIEAQTKKPVQVSAVTMALSRLHRQLQKSRQLATEDFYLDDIRVHAHLACMTFTKSGRVREALGRVADSVQRSGGFFTASEGTKEVTVILEERFLSEATREFVDKPKLTYTDVASVGVSFNERFIDVPAVLYLLLQQVTLQNVNVIEVASTATELIFYVKAKDVQIVFETLFMKFGKRQKGSPKVHSKASAD